MLLSCLTSNFLLFCLCTKLSSPPSLLSHTLSLGIYEHLVFISHFKLLLFTLSLSPFTTLTYIVHREIFKEMNKFNIARLYALSLSFNNDFISFRSHILKYIYIQYSLIFLFLKFEFLHKLKLELIKVNCL